MLELLNHIAILLGPNEIWAIWQSISECGRELPPLRCL